MDPSQSLNQIQFSPSLEEILRVGVVFLHSLSVGKESAEVERAVGTIGEELRRSMAGRRPSSLEPVQRARRLYKMVGLDPTKERPSSEKLLRRVLHGRPFPAVNGFVDAMNLVSLRLQFPLGFYDWDQIMPPVLLRIGRPDETYPGIAGEEVRLQGKIVLVDGEGPFGNPTHDSQRTRITERSVRALVIAFAPGDTPRASLEEVVREIGAAAKDFCGGRLSVSGILPP
jgi:DNA/RNA-binding domain of Phe-tRNA-synthetase-like protein